MTTDRALLRTAGLPIRAWLAAADENLAARVRGLAEAQQRYAELAAVLAPEIGDVLIPDDRLGAAQRRDALACRRHLHHGRPVPEKALRALADAAGHCGHPGLATRLRIIAALGGLLSADRDTVARAVRDESRRLLAAPWDLLHELPAGRQALADGTIGTADDIAARLRAGETWESKRLRRHSDHLWRMITRGAAKTTPRGWLGHTTLLPVGDGTRYAVRLRAEAATRWTANLHGAQASAPDDPDPLVSLAPLHRIADGHLHAWLQDDVEAPLRPVTVRLTPALAAACEALSAGARPLTELAARLPGLPVAQARAFVLRLAGLGICRLTVPAAVHRTGWRTVEAAPRPVRADGFVDVYRATGDTWPERTARLVQSALGPVQRLNALISADHVFHAPWLDGIGADPVPVLDLLTAHITTGLTTTPGRAAAGNDGWPVAAGPATGYARLLRMLDSHPGDLPFDLDDALLDELGAPPADYVWPLDCLVRPDAAGAVALDLVASAGMLDARFAGELSELHGEPPQVTAHRAFLRELDARTGVTSVEFLAPPLSARAANAVHRPLYTGTFTGDPAIEAYCGTRPRHARYLPLAALTVRRDGDRFHVAAHGEPVRIVYHATRQPLPPWDLLLGVLQGGRTPIAARFRRLRHSLAALPGRDHLPRITVHRRVVVSPAQWRVTLPWDPADPLLTRLLHLARLRDRLNLPRWVMVCPGPGGRPVPCDLDSVRAPAVWQSVVSRAGRSTPQDLILEEFTPAPDELPVCDGTEPVAAELLLRLPYRADPAVLAAATAAALAGAPPGHPDHPRTDVVAGWRTGEPSPAVRRVPQPVAERR
ncbi:hypothetical protein AB0G04_26250 [Actinoplanes sp. NPDC023801]|uniref:hypothetical protein n=1 Tax=Actinoplanes sp. NPDC023801 TaxID=3154595 RepID=UPI0033F9AB5C